MAEQRAESDEDVDGRVRTEKNSGAAVVTKWCV